MVTIEKEETPLSTKYYLFLRIFPRIKSSLPSRLPILSSSFCSLVLTWFSNPPLQSFTFLFFFSTSISLAALTMFFPRSSTLQDFISSHELR